LESTVSSFFNYINRVADGSGADLEQGMPAARRGQETLQ
jgi:hypothetical protein